MLELHQNVRQEITKLIPSSLIGDIACYVFYDNHPKDEKNIDITICTKNGELKEFLQRNLINSMNLRCVSVPSNISILRNNNSELFYLIATKDELFIISSKDKLQLHKQITNIDKYDINDTACSGQTCLQVIGKDDAVPINFDSNFKSLENRGIIVNTQNEVNSLPIINELKRKLVEARYTAKCNEKTYEQHVNLRQRVALSSYQSLHPDLSTRKDNMKKVSGALSLKKQKSWIKVCNNKIVIMFSVVNESKENIENIHLLLSSTACPSLVYTTKIMTRILSSPFWMENNTLNIRPNQDTALVAVMAMEELKHNVTSQIELSGSVSYKMMGKEYLLPFEDVFISSLMSMGDEFDVLSNDEASYLNTTLAVLAATEKTELRLRYCRNIDDPVFSLLDLFCTHLHMEKVGVANNVIVYRKSPYHALNGTMIVFHDSNSTDFAVSVHTRTPSQVLALLHYIYDAVPAKIVATTPNYKLTGKTEELSRFDEEIPDTSAENSNYLDYATSILNRCTKILEHLDNSMIKMSESKNPAIQSKVGSHIDLFAGGVDNFKEFRGSMLKEAKKGIDALIKSRVDGNVESDVMVID